MKLMMKYVLLFAVLSLSPGAFAYMNPSAYNMMGGAMMDPKNPQYQLSDTDNKTKSTSRKSTSATRSKKMSYSEREQLRRKRMRQVVNRHESQAAKDNREMLYGDDGLPLTH